MLTCDQLQNLDIHIGDISISKNGAKNAPVGLGADLKTLRLVLSKTPVLTTPFEPKAFDGGDRVSFDLRAGPLESKIDLLDSTILACVVQNKDKFWKKPPSDEELSGPALLTPDHLLQRLIRPEECPIAQHVVGERHGRASS